MEYALHTKRNLKYILESLYASYNKYQFVPTDPLYFVHRFSEKQDQEIAALLSAVIAFGRVEQIKRSLSDVFQRLDNSPSHYVNSFSLSRAQQDFHSFVHRFIRGKDLTVLLYFISQIYREYGSLYNFFLKGYKPSDDTITEGLKDFIKRILTIDCSPLYADGKLPGDAGVRFLLSSPEQGSACKRMNLFLRWMVRRGDGIDLGIWKDVSPSQLVIPLDTHVSRIVQCIGLTKYKNNSWKMALDVTRNLRKFDSADPVKYDFAFSRLGILGICSTDRRWCRECPLYPFCNK